MMMMEETAVDKVRILLEMRKILVVALHDVCVRELCREKVVSSRGIVVAFDGLALVLALTCFFCGGINEKEVTMCHSMVFSSRNGPLAVSIAILQCLVYTCIRGAVWTFFFFGRPREEERNCDCFENLIRFDPLALWRKEREWRRQYIYLLELGDTNREYRYSSCIHA